MGCSRLFSHKIKNLSSNEVDRLVRMGWEDRTTFEAIKNQFGFSENEFVRFMRTQLSLAAFSRWRKRFHRKGHLKHQMKRGFKIARFKCSRQSTDGVTKGWK